MTVKPPPNEERGLRLGPLNPAPHPREDWRRHGESIISPIAVRPTTGTSTRTSSMAAFRSNTISTPCVRV